MGDARLTVGDKRCSFVRTGGSERGWTALSLSLLLLLCGCLGPGAVVDERTGQRIVFANQCASFEPTATSSDWAVHLLRMAAGTYPGCEALPVGHVLSPDEATRQFRAAANAPLSVTWMGHSTLLLRIGGQVILTDPLLRERVGTSPFEISRLVPVLPDPALIERLDAVVISHADFDHMDIASLQLLARRFPAATLIVPSGTRRLALASGFVRIVEMPWYSRHRIGGLRITAVPAIHGLRRPPFPVDGMNWSGYVIEGSGRRLYFAGDTGMGNIFAEMRRRLGAVDYAFVPIGAYEPRDFQAPYHVNPEEAAEIARILGARQAIGMHWGTLSLSADSPMEQKSRFLAAGTRAHPTSVMRIGETRRLD